MALAVVPPLRGNQLVFSNGQAFDAAVLVSVDGGRGGEETKAEPCARRVLAGLGQGREACFGDLGGVLSDGGNALLNSPQLIFECPAVEVFLDIVELSPGRIWYQRDPGGRLQ